LGRKANFAPGKTVNFAPGKIPSVGNSPSPTPNVYNVPALAAQETAIHRAKFGWPSVTDVAAVTKARREPIEICWGTPNSRTDLSRADVHHIVRTCEGDIAA